MSDSWDPMDCNPPGSSIHGISQVRVLEWLPFPSPGDLPDPGIEPVSPALAGRFCTTESLRNITDTQISVTAQMLASSATWQGHAEQRGGWVTGQTGPITKMLPLQWIWPQPELWVRIQILRFQPLSLSHFIDIYNLNLDSGPQVLVTQNMFLQTISINDT